MIKSKIDGTQVPAKKDPPGELERLMSRIIDQAGQANSILQRMNCLVSTIFAEPTEDDAGAREDGQQLVPVHVSLQFLTHRSIGTPCARPLRTGCPNHATG